MANNIAKFTADTSDFSKKMDDVSRKLNAFGRNGLSSMGGLVGSFSKLAPAIGAAVGAAELFNKAVNSCQTTADAYAKMQMQVNTAIDNFFTSITTGDFSVFEQGLSMMLDKAGAYAEAIDQLANTQMSYSAIVAEETNEFQKQVTVMKTAKKGTDEYADAYNRAAAAVTRMRDAAQYVQQDLVTTLQSAVAKNSSLDASMISWDTIGQAIKANATKWGREGGIEEAKAEYEAYKKELRTLQTQNTNANKMNVNQRTDTEQERAARLAEGTAKLNEKYKDQIVLFTALEKWGDDFLKTMTDQYNLYYSLDSAIEGYSQRLAKLGKDMDDTGTKAENMMSKLSGKPITITQKDTGIYANVLSNGRSGWNGPQRTAQELPTSLNIDTKAMQRSIGDVSDIKAITDEYKMLNAEMEEFNDHLTGEGLLILTDSFEKLGTAIGGDIGKMATFIAQMVQQGVTIAVTIGSMQAEMAMRQASMATLAAEAAARGDLATAAMIEASAKTMAAHSKIPFVGIALGVGMVATLVATLMSLPKFASGARFDSPTLGVFGEAGPEWVLPDRKLEQFADRVVQKSNGGGQVEFKIRDRELVGILTNYNDRQKYH